MSIHKTEWKHPTTGESFIVWGGPIVTLGANPEAITVLVWYKVGNADYYIQTEPGSSVWGLYNSHGVDLAGSEDSDTLLAFLVKQYYSTLH